MNVRRILLKHMSHVNPDEYQALVLKVPQIIKLLSPPLASVV